MSHTINAFRRPDLPTEYFSGGGAHESCSILRSEDNKLRFCEDGTFWDLKDASGSLVDRKVVASCDPGRKQWNTVMGPLQDALSVQGSLWLVEFDEDGERAKGMVFEDAIPGVEAGKRAGMKGVGLFLGCNCKT